MVQVLVIFLMAQYHIFIFVSVPPPTVKLLVLGDWSVTELPSFKIKKPLVP